MKRNHILIVVTQLYLFLFSLVLSAAHSRQRNWTVADGLPTDEVQQIIQLPNRQMLINGVGVFALFDGRHFIPLQHGADCVLPLPHYVVRYGHQWQGDSLLWLRDFYHLYLFDAHTRQFRNDLREKTKSGELQDFINGRTGDVLLIPSQRLVLDSLGLQHNNNTVCIDDQGGWWIATRTDGIVYFSPTAPEVQYTNDVCLIDSARSMIDESGVLWHCRVDGLERIKNGESMRFDKTNVVGLSYNRVSFIEYLSDGRYLLCDSLSTLGYFLPRERRFVPVRCGSVIERNYRRLVGACRIDERHQVVYTQNGSFVIDIVTDSLSEFTPSRVIERYSDKYNCILRDHDGRLWVGTQNGLFLVDKEQTVRIGELQNQCIRSLLMDGDGNVWAGTACGISRITPTVHNLKPLDGIPATSVMERAAMLLSDGSLLFVRSAGEALRFHPHNFQSKGIMPSVVLTSVSINGEEPVFAMPRRLSYKENYLTFRFSSLDYASPSHTRYRYRLEGLENEWHVSNDGSGAAMASYTAVPPGHYTFVAQASCTDNGWNEPLSVEFTIAPPLWLAWWAKTLYALLSLSCLMFFMSIYIKGKKKKMEAENDERVNRLFELRNQARHRFAEQTRIDPSRLAANVEEERLMTALLKAIEEHLDDESYGVDQLARDVAVSRAGLYTHLRDMLGITPSDFIRNVRLKRAAQLLTDTQLSIADVATHVGFATTRNFSANFKRMFGILPSEYRQGGA